MTSDARLSANRANARRSTGPRTGAGKARSSRNALRYGLTARATPLVPGEDPAEYQGFAENLRTSLTPVGPLESVLAERVISAAWRLRRLGLVEAGLIASELHREYAQRASYRAEKHVKVTSLVAALESGLETRTVLDPAKHEAAQRVARKEWDAYAEPVPTLGRAFAEAEEKLAPLARHQTTLERSLYAALHELQRVQAVRAGEPVRAPAALDVTVTDERDAP